MNIDEIAKARDLVSGTIAGHLEHYVRSGKIKVEQVVKAENIAKFASIWMNMNTWEYSL